MSRNNWFVRLGFLSYTALPCFALLVLPLPTFAQGDPIIGKDLATTWCSSCHLIGETGTSVDGARPFVTIARDPKRTPEKLRGFLIKPHGKMPEINLTLIEIEHIISYMDSLK